MKINKIRKYYNSLIENAEINSWYNDQSLIEVYRSFMSLLCSNPSLIDLGSGSGSEAYKMSNLGAIVLGVDCSEKSIEIAKNRNSKANFIIGDITTDLSDAVKRKFDSAMSILTLNSLSIINLFNLLKNLKKIMKDNSYLLIIYKSSFVPYAVKWNNICNYYYYSEKFLKYIFSKYKFNYYKNLILPQDYANENYICIVFKYCLE